MKNQYWQVGEVARYWNLLSNHKVLVMLDSIEAALNSAIISNNQISFPIDISRGIYTKVKSMLEDIRGTWKGGKASCFNFEFNPSDIVESYLSGGVWPKKNPYALFPTPQTVIDYILAYTDADPIRFSGYEKVSILEPSAGRGDLIDAVVKAFTDAGIEVDVTCCELDPINIAILKDKGYCVVEGDFMQCENLGKFDLCIMNPPFQGNKYIKHINHAQAMLKQYGSLVAVAPLSLFSTSTKVALNLKEQVSAINLGDLTDVFDGDTFKDTDIETIVFNLRSESETKKDMTQLLDYACQLFTMCVTNNHKLNTQINRTKNKEDLKALMPELVSSYLRENRFAYINSVIEQMAFEELCQTKEYEAENKVAKKVVDTKEDSQEKQEATISTLLSDISDTISNISSVKNSTKTKSKPIVPIELIVASDGQYEMAF